MAKEIKPGARSKVILQDAYDAEEDYEVEHSGTPNPKGGRPLYDESPIRGGHILSYRGEHVNHKGHEIDEETGEVLDPDKYKDEPQSEL